MILVANFKSHKNTDEVLAWLQDVAPKVQDIPDIEIVVCPQFPSLAQAKWLIGQSNWSEKIHLGAQNVSAFGEGSFTGEVSASAIAGICDYVIVGHSERRRLFGENFDLVQKKITQALARQITPIVCVSQATTNEIELNTGQKILVAFEPPDAISDVSAGKTADAHDISEAITRIQNINAKISVLYGGSVSAETIDPLLNVKGLSGFLVGSASLESEKFLNVIYAIRDFRSTSSAG